MVTLAAMLAACTAPASPRPAPPSVPPGKLVSSPGPLIAGHAALACIECHVADSAQIASSACTACHASLAARIAANEGLHAQGPVRMQACNECHLDHRGQRFDARWSAFGGRDRFDHALTGWRLEKGHRVVCERCHRASSPSSSSAFAGASRACSSCHASPHAGTIYGQRDCEACHAPSFASFAVTAFDHDELAGPIGASHRRVACSACHTPQRGTAPPPTACASCHASRDPHDGRFSKFGSPPACERCHAPTTSFSPGQPPSPWKPNHFDHARDGKWELVAEHAELACRACHASAQFPGFARLKAGSDCTGCHEHRAVHERKYSNKQCLQCHVSPGAARRQQPTTTPGSRGARLAGHDS